MQALIFFFLKEKRLERLWLSGRNDLREKISLLYGDFYIWHCDIYILDVTDIWSKNEINVGMLRKLLSQTHNQPLLQDDGDFYDKWGTEKMGKNISDPVKLKLDGIKKSQSTNLVISNQYKVFGNVNPNLGI